MTQFIYGLIGSYLLGGIVLPIWFTYTGAKQLFIKNLAGIFNILMAAGLFVTLLLVLVNDGMDSFYLNDEGGWVIYGFFTLILVLAFYKKFRESIYSLLVVSILLVMTILIIKQFFTPVTY